MTFEQAMLYLARNPGARVRSHRHPNLEYGLFDGMATCWFTGQALRQPLVLSAEAVLGSWLPLEGMPDSALEALSNQPEAFPGLTNRPSGARTFTDAVAYVAQHPNRRMGTSVHLSLVYGVEDGLVSCWHDGKRQPLVLSSRAVLNYWLTTNADEPEQPGGADAGALDAD